MTHSVNAAHAQVLEAYQRYQRDFVEGLNLCPWAKAARERGQVALQITEGASAEAVVELLQQWADNAQVVVGLAVCLDFTDSRRAFERFVNRVVDLDRRRDSLQSPVFALAAFHPHASPPSQLDAKAEAWVPYIRRSPNPTIQAIRMSALEEVRGTEPGGTEFLDLSQPNLDETLKRFTEEKKPLRQRIAEANLATLQRVGLSKCEALLGQARSKLDEHNVPEQSSAGDTNVGIEVHDEER